MTVLDMTTRLDLTDATARVRRTADGYLIAEPRVARSGIQLYSGYEVGRPDLATVRVYRPAEEVFAQDAVASMAHKPVTLDHPQSGVNAKNWRSAAVGSLGGDLSRDGDYLRVPLSLMDAAAIAAVESGKKEISLGYTVDLDWTAGTTPSGEAYDAIQRRIRVNHCAIVERARGGTALTIGDAGPSRVVDAKGHPAGHAPGYCFGTSSQARDAAYLDYKRGLSNAYRGPTQPPGDAGRAPVTLDREASYRQYEDHLTNAWRRGG